MITEQKKSWLLGYHCDVLYMEYHRYLIEHSQSYQKDDGLAERLLRELVQLDPSCLEVLQLAELLLAKGIQINAH